MANEKKYKGVATQWTTMLHKKGVPVAAARALGAYISGLEKRLAKLDKKVVDLARTSHKHD